MFSVLHASSTQPEPAAKALTLELVSGVGWSDASFWRMTEVKGLGEEQAQLQGPLSQARRAVSGRTEDLCTAVLPVLSEGFTRLGPSQRPVPGGLHIF
ncbi:hypothetical protein EYF80_013943 [Liparis tanakae]|uniref:Uncharacterized protein n=1 Tax=Liparis tanakae TaxID=230148 RepID=A0A4Z2ICX8_9TELE|nr:hypothetical protein EYF80_013943 [Liparis tanakae]